jgi:hypothetical protein
VVRACGYLPPTLVNRLQAQTDAGSLQWELTDRGETFVAVLSGASIEISGHDKTFFMTVRNEDGQELERAFAQRPDEVSGLLVGLNVFSPPPRPIDSTLSRLHTTVRRSVMRVDETLDSLIDQLNG